jgi:DNA-binding LacI/PurR family transcriptional regulator
MKATRKDVAQLAGVSTATVSYVLNKNRSISPKTAEKVMSAVESLNYKPDMIARSMTMNETMQLGIVLESISNPFYGEIVHGFENAANANGYFVNICTGHNKLDDYFENFISRRLDGIFIAAMPFRFNVEKLYRLVDNGIKVVVSGNTEADMKIVSSIENDHISAMNEAVTYLYNLGHTNIAYLSGLGRVLQNDRRIEGYLDMVNKLKLPYGDSLLFDGKPPYTTDVEDGYRLACELIDSKQKFSAVICLNDLMAMGASNAFQQRGYRIPEDVSLMGFDDIIFSSFWNPPITTMALQKISFGAKAFELLNSNIKNGNTGFYMNKLQLIKRKSTAPFK